MKRISILLTALVIMTTIAFFNPAFSAYVVTPAKYFPDVINKVITFAQGIIVGSDTSEITFASDGTITTDGNTITYGKGVILDVNNVTIPGAGSGYEYQILASDSIVNFVAYDTFSAAKMPVPVSGQSFLLINSIEESILVSQNDAEQIGGGDGYNVASGETVRFTFDGTTWRKNTYVKPTNINIATTTGVIGAAQDFVFLNGNSITVAVPQTPEDGHEIVIKSLGTSNVIGDGVANKKIEGVESYSLDNNTSATIVWSTTLDTWKVMSTYVTP